MSNGYRGEREVELYGIKYKMIFNMNVLAAFESNTGKDFNHVAIKARMAYMNSSGLENYGARAEIMTGAVSMSDAAWLFYLAAKEANPAVEFGEIQEAVMLEGAVDEDRENMAEVKTYPLKFVDVVVFAQVGILDDLKKKHLPESTNSAGLDLSTKPPLQPTTNETPS